MIVQSLHVNYIIGSAATLVANLRDEIDLNTPMPARMLILDTLRAIGIPDRGLAMIFSRTELTGLVDYADEDDMLIKCQRKGCDEEATVVEKYRNGWLLLCDDCQADMAIDSYMPKKHKETK